MRASRRRGAGVLPGARSLLMLGFLLGAGHGLAPAQIPSNQRLSEAERRGKQIYLRGSPEGGREIVCLFGDERTEIPASALPCVNCHGYDGKGRPEGGVSPSNITWMELTKPYGTDHPGGRKHPPYDALGLRKAITMGVDPGGNELSTAMPRFQLTTGEVEDLVAFLQRLGRDPDPGLADDTLTLGCLLPGEPGKDDAAARSVRAVLEAWFEDVNASGGVHGRRIELVHEFAGPDEEACVVAMRRLVDREPFALAGAFLEGAEGATHVVREEELPLVGAQTPFPRTTFPLNRYVFYLSSGVAEQARAMVRFAHEQSAIPVTRVAVLVPSEKRLLEAAAAVQQACQGVGWDDVMVRPYPAEEILPSELLETLHADGVDTLFFFGPGQDQRLLLHGAQRLSWAPAIYVPGPLAEGPLTQAPAGFAGTVYVSFPRGPGDQTEQGIRRFLEFAQRHELPEEEVSQQVAAYCSAAVLTEALRRSGRDVTRQKLTTILEGFFEYETGLTPEITFGPNRRVGAQGAYVARIDPITRRFVPVSEWIEVR